MSKRNLDITARVAGLLIVTVLAAAICFELPSVQKKMTGRLLEKLSASKSADVSCSSIEMRPFNIFVIKDFLVKDKTPYTEDKYGRGWAPSDTILYCGSVRGTLTLRGLFSGEGLHIGRVDVDNALFHIVSEPDGKYPDNLSRFFAGPGPHDVPQASPNIFDARVVRVSRFRFKLNNFNPQKVPYKGYGINWEDIDVSVQKLKAHGMRFSGGRMSFVVDRMDVTSKTGYHADLISGRARIGLGKTEVENFHLKDKWTDIVFKSYTMTYENAKAFRYYLEKVRMGLTVERRGVLGSKTLSGIAGIFNHMDLCFDIQRLHADGFVNDMDVDLFNVTEKNSGVYADLTAHATGLPDITSLLTKADIKKLTFTTDGASRFISALTEGRTKPQLGHIAKGTIFCFCGGGSGPINKLNVYGKLSSGIGKANAGLQILNLTDPVHDTEISGSFGTLNLDLGKILETTALGPCTMHTGARARLTAKGPSIIMDSLKIDGIEANGYRYSGIAAAGKLSDKIFDGKLICNDPNLNFLFQGVCNLSTNVENAVYRFYANLGYADLKTLNIYKREGTAKVACRISADYIRKKVGDVRGKMEVHNLMLEDNGGKHELGDILALSETKGPEYRMLLRSAFLEGKFTGTGSAGEFVSDLQAHTTRKHLSALYSLSSPAVPPTGKKYSVNLLLHDTREILPFIKEKLYIAENTDLAVTLNENGDMDLKLKSPRLGMDKDNIREAILNLDNKDGSLNATVTGSCIQFGGLNLSDAALKLYAKDNSASIDLHYNDADRKDDVGELYVETDLSRSASDTLIIEARPLESYLDIAGNRWHISPSSIVYKPDNIKINSFKIFSGAQSIELDGGASRTGIDTLKFNIDSLNMAGINSVTKLSCELGGLINGSATLVSPINDNIHLTGIVIGDSLKVDGERLGSLNITGVWDNDAESLRARISNALDGRQALVADGSYEPTSKQIDISADMNRFNVGMVAPFARSIFSESRGCISGKIHAKGPTKEPDLSSEGLTFDETTLRVAFTNVPYSLNGPFHIDNQGVIFDDVTIHDDKGGKGRIGGGIRYEKLKNIRLDASLKAEDIEAIAIDSKTDGVNGNLNANADVHVSGPFDNILISGSVSTSGQGNITIPVNSATASKNSDLLTFVQPAPEKDPYEEMVSSNQAKRKQQGNLRLDVTATAGSGTEARIEIDKASGNVVVARGNGTVHLQMNTGTKSVKLGGMYSLNGGKYHFEIPGVIGKDFNIVDGSSIKFNGDIASTVIDLSAVYNVKSSLSALLSDTTSVSTRRPVECYINISGPLTNMQIGFDVKVPDLDPVTRNKVESALNTDDKKQKQFIALLVMGTFLPNEQYGVFNSSNILYSNVGAIMSNQLNNILQRLEIPIDLGIGYQQTEGGTNIFDVAVSTQLFNNRVVVNGSVGNRKYSTSKSANGEVVGDVDIEVKLDKSGLFRLKMFSHSADEFTSFLDHSQRNGLGMTYQQEYTNFFRFISDIFSSKKKREEREAAEAEKEKEMKTISIDE